MSVNSPDQVNPPMAQGPLPDVALTLAKGDGNTRIFDRFLEHVARQPEAIALAHATGSVSYAGLEALSRNVALDVLSKSASADDVIAIYGRRCAGLVVAMLGCLRAGRRFAVLDAGYPLSRLSLLGEIIRPSCLLLSSEKDAETETVSQLLTDCPRLLVPTLATASVSEAGSGELDQVAASRIAYLLFTSGTTGVPKCVQACHEPLVHFIDWYARQFSVTQHSRFSMLAGLAHDPIFRDVFVALSSGASVYIPEQEWILHPSQLVRWLFQSGITHTHLTPQLGRVICTGSEGIGQSQALQFIGCGGDALKTQLVNDLRAVAPKAAVVNFYGATETPQAMAFHVCENSLKDPIPVGRGIADVQLLILNDAGELCGQGVDGQVALRTHFLSSGYLNDASLTSQKFIQLKDKRGGDAPCYLTGDYGYYRPDGVAVVRGRVDDQVKIRGYRVELAEVMRRVERIAGVQSCIVIADATPSGEKQLLAYLVPKTGATKIAELELRQLVAADLPSYMVPAHFVWLAQMPLLPNGKVDRQRLPRPAAIDAAGGEGEQPATELERKIAASWSSVLGLRRLSVDRTFVELGGDSLSFIHASAALERILGVLPQQWEQLTIRQLAERVPVAPGLFSQADVSVVLRAIAITLLVTSNYQILVVSGTTSALFIISGMSFGRYHLRAALQTGSVSTLLGTALKIALPTVLLTFLQQLLKWREGFHWETLALVANFFDPTADLGPSYWFIYVLIQLQLGAALLFSFPAVREAFRRYKFWAPMSAALAGAVLHFSLPLIPALNTDHLFNRVPQMYAGIFFTGCALVFADTAARKLMVYALGTLLFLGSLLLSDHAIPWFPNLALALLLLATHVPLPKLLSRAFYAVASASLYLYLAQFPILGILTRLKISNGWLMISCAIIAGVVTAVVWERLYAFGMARLRSGGKGAPVPADAVAAE